MNNKDWVDVKLSEFGERYLKENGGGSLRVHEGRFELDFEPGKTQRVTRAFDWEKVLRNQHVNGQNLFEIVEAPAGDAAAEIEDQEVKF